MNCEKINARLSRYQDGELPETLRAEVHRHLETCETCANQFRQLQDVTTGITQMSQVATANNFTAQVMARVNEKKQRSPLGLPSFVYSFVFILFLLLGFLINGAIENQTPALSQQEIQLTETIEGDGFTAILAESRSLNLIDVHDTSLDMALYGDDTRGVTAQ
ncbi:MAG: hypothetical protein GY765_23860 [bacterium]|nr:hypothetical protein [bacterium]